MITLTIEEHIVMLAKELHAQGGTSTDILLPFYNGLVEKVGNKFVKQIDPVFLQRNSKERTLTDIFNPFFLQKDSYGRYTLYNHDAANRGNMIIVSTTEFKDCFGNEIRSWHPYQINGNTLIVLLTQILNDELKLQKNVSYRKSDLLPEAGEELKYELIVINDNDDLNRIYNDIDNTSSSKSKADNYTSVLGGFGLMNVTNGASDLRKWAQSEMDGPISLIDNIGVPKKVQDMAKTVKPYLPFIIDLDPKTDKIISNAGKWSRVFKALCLDITAYSKANLHKGFRFCAFMDRLEKAIKILEDSNVEEYWQKKLFPSRLPTGHSKINWKGKKVFSEWIRHPQANVFALEFNAIDWFLWELFSLKCDVGDTIQELNIYVKGGGETAGDDRLQHQYKELNFLRLVFIYAMSNGVDKRFSVADLMDWADETKLFDFPRDCYVTTGTDFIKLGSVRSRGKIPTLRSVLKQFFYSNT